MSVYDSNGNVLTSLYDAEGDSLDYAYDIDGNLVFNAYDDQHFKVMTYNVGQWYIGGADNVPVNKDAEYYDLQNGMIRRANADILFICEYWDMFSKMNRTALSILSQYYPYIETLNGESGYFGRAICSKYPISDYTAHTYSTGNGQYYDSATVVVDDIPITLVVTHLRSNSDRTTQIRELITFLQTLTRFICCGDFNMRDCDSTAGADYTAIIQPLLNAGFNSANCTDFGFLQTYSDAPDSEYAGCLDNIVTSSNITILSASVDTTKLTDGINDRVDHMPLIAELQID